MLLSPRYIALDDVHEQAALGALADLLAPYLQSPVTDEEECAYNSSPLRRSAPPDDPLPSEGNVPMRVATYTRISTDEDHQPYSLEAQAERLGNYVASQDGWELVRRFTDQASGATTERPGLKRALSEAKAHRFDLLLVYRVDRFARSVRGLARCSKNSIPPEWRFARLPSPLTPRRRRGG